MWSMPKRRRAAVSAKPPSTSGEHGSDMTQAARWPNVNRALVAILRGVRPDEAEVIVGALIESGFELIEVPLNSPDPFVSIERLCKRFGSECWIGAGTVLTAGDCARVADLGGRLMVSPNIDADVLTM